MSECKKCLHLDEIDCLENKCDCDSCEWRQW